MERKWAVQVLEKLKAIDSSITLSVERVKTMELISDVEDDNYSVYGLHIANVIYLASVDRKTSEVRAMIQRW